MGLSLSMVNYITPALLLTPLLALSMTAAAYTRGQLLASRKTGAIAFASVARILAVCATGLIALFRSAESRSRPEPVQRRGGHCCRRYAYCGTRRYLT